MDASNAACRGLTRAARRYRRVLPAVLLALSAQGCANSASLSPGAAIDNTTREKLAAAARAAGDPDGALALLGNAAAHDSDPVLRMQYAETLIAAGRGAEGVRVAESVQARRPDDTQLARTVGRLAVKAGEGAAAARAFQSILARTPNDAEALDGLGVSYALRRNWPSAIATFRLALQQHPEDRATRNNLALVYALSGEPDKAVKLLEAIAGDGAPSRIRHNLALAYAAKGDAPEAAALLSRLVGPEQAEATAAAYAKLAGGAGNAADPIRGAVALAPVQVSDPEAGPMLAQRTLP